MVLGKMYDSSWLRILVGLIWAFAADICRGNAQEQLIDRIAGTVDGRPVLESDVQKKVAKGPLVVVSDYPATEKSTAYERALQDLLNFQMVLAKAKDLDIEFKDEDLESEIGKFIAESGMTRDTFLDSLAREGLSYEDYRRDFRDHMILRRFQGRVIGPMIKVTDKDVETFYLKKMGSTGDLMELTLRQIMIAVPSGAIEDVASAKQKLAREVHQKLVGGMGFADAVKVYSDEPQARESGGLMAPVRAKDLAQGIRVEVENLDVGQFSMPVRTAVGYHIFLLEERKFSGNTDFQKQKSRLEAELRMKELGEQTKRWLIEQRQRSKIEVMVP